MSDAYSFDADADPAAPTDPQQRRLLYLQRLQQAANPTAGQSASAPPPQSIPNVSTSAPEVQPPATDRMLEALRAANAPAPVAASSDQSPRGQTPAQTEAPQTSTTQPAAGGMLQALRGSLHNKVDQFVDSQKGFDENGTPTPAFRNVMNVHQVAASYLPGPVGDVAANAVDSEQASNEGGSAPRRRRCA
jgi:hypothetical protein